MLCPTCRQTCDAPATDGRCPTCGAAVVAPAQPRMVLYVITTGIFLTVLCYGALVAILESTGQTPKAVAPPAVRTGLLLAAILLWIPMYFAEQVYLARNTPSAARAGAVLVAALAEGQAILGLAAYFLGGGVQWFTYFVALSLLSFLYLWSRMPTYVRMVEGDTDGNP